MIGEQEAWIGKILSNVSRREFVTMAVALSLAAPKGVLALAQKEAPPKAGAPVNPDDAWHDLLSGGHDEARSRTLRNSLHDDCRIAVLALSWWLLDSCECRNIVLQSLAAAGRVDTLPSV